MDTATALALATAKIADVLTSAYGTRWYACRDTEGGEWHVECCESGAHLDRDAVCVEFARSPGVGNMDSTEWTAGLDLDAAGDGSGDVYYLDGEFFSRAPLECVIAACCEKGDVTHHIADLEAKLVESCRRLQIAETISTSGCTTEGDTMENDTTITDCLRLIAEYPSRYTGGQSLAGYADSDADEAAGHIVRRLYRDGGEPEGLHAAIVAAIEADVAAMRGGQ